MLSQQFRHNFLGYFKTHNHTLLPSSSTIPHDDPTLLFTNAGMNQFKDIFLGKTPPPYPSATTAQKCIRVGGKHNDLDNVGHTSRHLTFFEMLGNFSFGQYFKSEAIQFAWDVSTSIFQLDPSHIWVTVFQDDDEAFELWKPLVPEHRIIRMGEKDNFWAMGDTGPCGPCSELYFDRGESYGDAATLLHDTTGERFLEFWNLVFMQFNRDSNGKMTPLPTPCIDTGCGLERLISLKMGVDNLFSTDILRSLIAEIETLAQKTYNPEDTLHAPAFHVIADHIRSLAFAISDGAQPSNIERGYVLRKLLRRAVRYGRLLGLQDPFLSRLLPRLIQLMGSDYPELKAAHSRTSDILHLEEEAFLRTLKRGGSLLFSIVATASERPSKEITGPEAFKLKDTYGLPLEEILLVAKDAHLSVNLEAFELLEQEAKEKSKAAHATVSQEAEESLYQKCPLSQFIGYTTLSSLATIQEIIIDGHQVSEISTGQTGIVLLDSTPFYAEKGGQVGDTGFLSTSTHSLTVTHCTSPFPGITAHFVRCDKGPLRKGDQVTATVDVKRRTLIQNNHTATHLLHMALTHVLGNHIKQTGSLVDEKKLRFDFSHHKPLSHEEIEAIEDLVNLHIRANTSVSTYEIPYDEAREKSDIKQFFGDKYGPIVRVVDIDASKELCGGTHTTATGTLGLFRIVKEGSIASGMRRIEAVTGEAALLFARSEIQALHAKLTESASQTKTLQEQVKAARKGILREQALALAATAIDHVVTASVTVQNDELVPLSEAIATHLKSGVVALALKSEDKCHVIIRITPDLVKQGLNATTLLKQHAPLIGGSGGGKPELAQAGGKSPEHIELFFSKIRESLRGAQ